MDTLGHRKSLLKIKKQKVEGEFLSSPSFFKNYDNEMPMLLTKSFLLCWLTNISSSFYRYHPISG
jgi:hypothetical protein